MKRTFRYTAYSPSGHLESGKEVAFDEEEFRYRLEGAGFEIQSVTTHPWDIHVSLGSGKVSIRDQMLFTRTLASLLRTGITTADALEVLHKQSDNPAFQDVILEVSRDVQSGMPMSDALAKHPKAFPAYYGQLVRAGEQSSSLPPMLEELAKTLKRTHHLGKKVQTAMMYPAIVLGVVSVIAIAALYFVIPSFTEIFEKGGYDLPAFTLFLIGMSEIARSVGPIVLVALAAAAILFPRFAKLSAIRERLDAIQLRLPLIGSIARGSTMANYCRYMAMMVGSGTVARDALELTTHALPNRHIAKAFRKAVSDFAKGSSLTPALAATGHVTPYIITATEAGERSGTLEEQYSEAADFYEEETLEAVERATSMLEPIMTIIIFMVVGSLALAIYQPLIGAFSAMR